MPVVPVGYNVMMGKTNPVPYEDQATMSEVQRRNALLQQMLNQSMQGASGVVPDSGVLKVPNYAGAIGKILESVIGVKGAQNAAEDQARIADRAQQTHRSEMEKFADTAYGKEYGGYKMEGGPEMAGPPRGPTEYTGKSKGDLAKALANAATSIDPQTRTFGTELQKEDVKRMIAGRVEPHDVIQYGSNYDPNTLPPEWRAMAPGMQLPPTRGVHDNVYSEITHDASGKPQMFKQATQTFGEPTVDPTTGLPGQYSLETNKFESKTGGPTQPVTTHMAGVDTKRLETNFDKAQEAVTTLKNVATIQDQLKNINPQALGPMTDWRLLYNQLIQQVGGKPIPESVAVERLNSELGERLTQVVKAFAPVTKVDLSQGEKIAGSTKNSVETLMAMSDWVAGLASRTINVNNQFATDLEQIKGYEGGLDRYKVNLEMRGQEPTQARTDQQPQAQPQGMRPKPLSQGGTLEQWRDFYKAGAR